MQDVQSCGQGAFFLVFLGVTGFVASFLSIILSSIHARTAARAAAATLALGVLTVVFAVGAARRLDAREREGEGRIPRQAPVSVGNDPNVPADVQRLDPAKGCVILGAQAGSMPILAGLGALLWARRSRRSHAEPDLP